MARRPLIAVVGGGISGLAAAWELARDDRARVVVYEASRRLGGVISTREIGGVPVEQGPDAILEGPGVMAFLDELGLRDELVRPEVFGALVATDRGLRPLPSPTALGVPVHPFAAVRSGLLSPSGGLRCWSELITGRRLSGDDVSIGSFVAERFGHEVLGRMVDPMLAGARAGDPDKMSLAAAAPQLDRAARTHRSTLAGLRKGRPGSPSFVSIDGGLIRIVERLERLLGPRSIRTATRVTRVVPKAKKVVLEGPGDPVDGAVVATPAHASRRILAGSSAGDALGEIDHASFAIATLLYEGDDDALPGPGSGILVPSDHNQLLAAATFYSRKWPAASPEGATIIRAVAGRAGDPSWLKAPADQIALALDIDVRLLLAGIKLELRKHVLNKLPHSLPHYEVGHRELVEEALDGVAPRIALAGAWVRGTGIPDCIEAGRAAARRVLNDVLV